MHAAPIASPPRVVAGIAFVAVASASSGMALSYWPRLGCRCPSFARCPPGGCWLARRPSQPARIVALWRSAVNGRSHSRLQPSRSTIRSCRCVRQLAAPTCCFALLVIAVTAVINFTNFMDGLDGLVAGCMAVAIGALSLSLNAPWSLWALVGSLLGFLIWNWSPAKVFMGDVGSTFLGAVFAGLVLQASSWIEAFGYLLVATPLLADACLCVPRRLLAGQRVFQAHRLHLFQRLQQAGWPHARVSLSYIAGTALLAVAMLVGGWPWVFSLAVAELLIGVWLDQRVAVPFAVASKS